MVRARALATMCLSSLAALAPAAHAQESLSASQLSPDAIRELADEYSDVQRKIFFPNAFGSFKFFSLTEKICLLLKNMVKIIDQL